MLAEPKLKIFLDLIHNSTKEELIWLNGYLTAVINNGTESDNRENTIVPKENTEENSIIRSAHKITIVYGTETGNSKKLATDFAAKAKKSGHQVKLSGLDQYRLTDLPKEEYLFTIISTQGDGEPPVAAQKFYDHIHKNGLNLDNLKYGVLALGDSSYPLFCKTGEDVDIQLKKMGGERFISFKKCDIDYETEATNWFDHILASLKETTLPKTETPTIGVPVKKPAGKTIYTGTVITNINLNDRGSNKETRHIEIVADNVEYEPGDSLGVVPENTLDIVEAILAFTGVNGDKKINYKEEQVTVFNLLKKKLNITYLHERVVKKYADIVQQDIPDTKMDLLNLLKIYPPKGESQFEDILSILNLQSPRLYTISSSPSAHPGEVHITVAKDEFVINTERKYGVCSDFLSQVEVDMKLVFFIQKNKRFRLPLKDTTNIIMIGPGTGIAPFRSFVAERDATGATGKNWLFFGDQYFVTDFLYQTEWQNWLSMGVLNKISVAFSRDQKEKVYVQHKMKQQAGELMEWIDNGAHLYICGAKEPMSVDVEQSLVDIISEQKVLSQESAKEFLNELKESGRYHKDVY